MSGYGRPEAKAELAALGLSLDPNAKLSYVEKPSGPVAVILLDRVRSGWTPPYCLHGFASCVRCDNMCYLGNETEKIVTAKKAYPLCQTCALELRDAGTWDENVVPVSHVQDHLRTEGPH